ncbi:hypothetical protein [Lacinutrix sp. MEBiC02595]
MKFKIEIIIIFCLLLSCKKEIKNDVNDNPNIELNVDTTKPEKSLKNKQDSIPIYSVSYTKDTSQKTLENLSIITKKLQSQYITYPFKFVNELEEIRTNYDSKSFLKMLARDFKNDDFLDISTRYYSFVVPNNNLESHYIAVEEWQYPTTQKAKSVFESLKTYRDREIKFKTINWIWVHQKEKIYLIFSTAFMVKESAMQNIKTEIIKTASAIGDYETLQFYE